ncbi:MAG: hypothetical protein L0K82_07490 [Pisciglobus halotolerans]|nr:hypothetical protein [Pisciglobus halotolerans]
METLDILTNDAKFLLTKMYAEYIERRNNGDTKEQATNFDNSETIHKEIMPEWKMEDVDFTISELASNKLLNAVCGSNSYYRVAITPIAISLMESKFKDDFKTVLSYAAKIKSLIPFI